METPQMLDPIGAVGRVKTVDTFECKTECPVTVMTVKWTISNFSVILDQLMMSRAVNCIDSAPFTINGPYKDANELCCVKLQAEYFDVADRYIPWLAVSVPNNVRKRMSGMKEKYSILCPKDGKRYGVELAGWFYDRYTIYEPTPEEETNGQSIYDEAYGQLLKDEVTIVFEFSVTWHPVHIDSAIKIPECDMRERIHDLFKSGDMSDVMIEASGQEFRVHKAILAAGSPIFSKMFNTDMKEKNENRLRIDADAEAVKEMLHFIYTGKATRLEKTAGDLLPLAAMYELKRLQAMCELEMWKNISVENAIKIFTLADLYNSRQLKDKVIDFCNKNFTQVKNTSDFKSLMNSRPELVLECWEWLANGINK